MAKWDGFNVRGQAVIQCSIYGNEQLAPRGLAYSGAEYQPKNSRCDQMSTYLEIEVYTLVLRTVTATATRINRHSRPYHLMRGTQVL